MYSSEFKIHVQGLLGCKETRQGHRKDRIISLLLCPTAYEDDLKYVFNIGTITSLSK